MKTLLNKVFLSAIALTFVVGLSQANAKTYTIGVENISYYPHYDQVGGEYVGFSREIFDEFGKHKGYNLQYEIRPIKRLFLEFVDRKSVDFKYPDCSNWQSDRKKGKNVFYSQPVVNYIDGFMVRPEKKGSDINAMNRIGIPLGFTLWNEIKILKKKVKIYENKSFSGLLQQGIKNRIDAVAQINIAVARHQLDKVLKKPGGLVFDKTLPYKKGSYYLSTIKYPGVIKEFNQFMVRKKNLVKSLKRKYKVNLM